MNVPQHVVIVPDGNRRWAKAKNKPAFHGHRRGAEAMEKISKAALDLDIPCLTIWGCSVSNVTERSALEVKYLLKIFELYFKKLLKDKGIEKHGVRVNVLGRWEELFPKSLAKVIREVMKATAHHQHHQLTLLMAYSGVEEMTQAVRAIAEQTRANPDFEVNEKAIKASLWSRDLPPVDLVIRTGGEPHWSAGLLMWDVAEARLYFTKTLWPDFAPEEFGRAVDGFAAIERRFGR